MESTMTYRYVGLPYAMTHSGNTNLRLPRNICMFQRSHIYIYTYKRSACTINALIDSIFGFIIKVNLITCEKHLIQK